MGDGTTRYVALLRAVNLGAKRKVPMAALRSTLTEAGYEDVVTYLQSGNAVFGAAARSSRAVQRAVAPLIADRFGFDVDVAVRSARELGAVARAHAFGGRSVDPKSLHVGFLTAKPGAAAVRELADLDFGREQFELRGTEIFLSYPDGLGRSKMNPAVFEKALDIPITVRTWRVVNKLAELARAGT